MTLQWEQGKNDMTEVARRAARRPVRIEISMFRIKLWDQVIKRALRNNHNEAQTCYFISVQPIQTSRMFLRNSKRLVYRSKKYSCCLPHTEGSSVRAQPSNTTFLNEALLSKAGGNSFWRTISTAMNMKSKLLTVDTLNPNIKNVEYAVRGPIVQLASKLEKELEQAS